MSDEIAPKMSDNEALRRILAQCITMEDFLTKDYDDIEGTNSVEVSDVDPFTRGANSRAVRCVITNRDLDGDEVKVHEDDKLVRILQPGETWESPTRGKLAIRVTCNSGEASTIAVATYVRNI